MSSAFQLPTRPARAPLPELLPNSGSTAEDEILELPLAFLPGRIVAALRKRAFWRNVALIAALNAASYAAWLLIVL